MIIVFYFELTFPFGFHAHSSDIFWSLDVRERNYRSTIGLPTLHEKKANAIASPARPPQRLLLQRNTIEYDSSLLAIVVG